MQKYYFVGLIALVIFWLISWLVTKNPNPFALAKGKGNDNLSASLLQALVFTMLTLFAYTTVFAARAWAVGSGVLSGVDVPANLLILMGVSATTAVASRAIRVEQEKTKAGKIKSGELLPKEDKSDLLRDQDGKTDLVKIQMLMWTVIAVGVYLFNLVRFVNNECYTGAGAPPLCPGGPVTTLPDIDTAFMALLTVSHAGYIVNKLSEGPPVNPGTPAHSDGPAGPSTPANPNTPASN